MPMFKAKKRLTEQRTHSCVEKGMYVEVLGSDGGTFVIKNLHTNRIFNLSKTDFEANMTRVGD